METTIIEELIGKTMASVKNLDNEILEFLTVDGQKYQFYHDQDCCESVSIDDVCGDLNDLVGSPILIAEESISENENPPDVPAPKGADYEDPFTWTFYTFRTMKGTVTVRWYGTSNGYYSQSVSFTEVK